MTEHNTTNDNDSVTNNTVPKLAELFALRDEGADFFKRGYAKIAPVAEHIKTITAVLDRISAQHIDELAGLTETARKLTQLLDGDEGGEVTVN